MLGDVDRQQSVVPWLRRRAAHGLACTPIVGWAVDPRNVLRPPAGVAHVILDTPAGMQGFDINRLLMSADAVLIPVCDSVFDRESAAAGLAELRTHPRVASGRVRLAAVGMRIDARTRAEEGLRDWAQALNLPFLGVLRATRTYVNCIERGLTVFDLPPAQAQADQLQWRPVLDWLAPVFDAPAEAVRGARAGAAAADAVPATALAAMRTAPVVTPLAPPPVPRRPAAPRLDDMGYDPLPLPPRLAEFPKPRSARLQVMRKWFGWLVPMSGARSGT
jgi:chromosome partitioning protein